MGKEDLNEILLHAVLNGLANHYYLQEFYFEIKTYKETCNMFKIMEIYDQVYEGRTPSMTIN